MTVRAHKKPGLSAIVDNLFTSKLMELELHR